MMECGTTRMAWPCEVTGLGLSSYSLNERAFVRMDRCCQRGLDWPRLAADGREAARRWEPLTGHDAEELSLALASATKCEAGRVCDEMEVESLDHKDSSSILGSRAGPKLLSAPTPEGSWPMAGSKNLRWPHKIGKLGSWGRTPGLCYANPRPISSVDPIIRGPASRYRYRWLSVAAVPIWPICSSLLSGPDCFSYHRSPISLTLLFSISFFSRRPSLCQTQDGV